MHRPSTADGEAAVTGRRPAEAVAAAVGQTVSVPLREASGSVVGWTILTPDGERTIAAVSVEGIESGLPAHIHAGGCDALDPAPAFPLTDVYPDRPTTTTVEVRLDDLLAGAYAIAVHQRSPNLAALHDPSGVVACGDLSGTGGGSAVAASRSVPAAEDGTVAAADVDGGSGWRRG